MLIPMRARAAFASQMKQSGDSDYLFPSPRMGSSKPHITTVHTLWNRTPPLGEWLVMLLEGHQTYANAKSLVALLHLLRPTACVRRLDRQLQRRVMRCLRSADLVFCDQLPNFWNEINWHFDRRVSGVLKCSFVLGHGFFVALRFVVIEYLLDPALIPSGWKVFFTHCALLRLRRRARFAFGPSSYAVITKTEFGMGSGT